MIILTVQMSPQHIYMITKLDCKKTFKCITQTKMYKIKDIVEWLLISNAQTRDSDPLLYVLVAEAKGYDWLWLQETLEKLSFQSVLGIRQNLQMNNPELRWKKYLYRQKRWGEKRKEYSRTYWEKLKSFISND